MGCHHLVESVLLLLGMVSVVVVGKPLPHAEDDSNDCRFQDYIEVSYPSEVHLLTHVSRSLKVVLVFTYPEPVNEFDTRDAVTLNSTEAIHSDVRDGKTTNYSLHIPLAVPEGWNILRLNISEKTVNCTLVQGEDEVDLFSILLKDTVSKMHAEGSVALCPQASPNWVVDEEKEVKVILQPGTSGRDQWLEVIAGDSAHPYIKLPSTNLNKSVPANSTLKVTTTLLGNYVLMRLFKSGDNGDEEVARGNMNLTTLPWSLLVGGASHIRLTLSPPRAATPARYSTSIVPYLEGAGYMLAVMVCLLVALWIKKHCNRKFYRKDDNENIRMALLSESLSALSQRQDFTGNNVMTYTEEGQEKTLEVVLRDPVVSHSMLTALKEHEEMAKVKVFSVRVPKVRKMRTRRSDKLPSLPDVEEVTLKVEDIQANDLDNVRNLAANLQPNSGGFSRIELTGKMKAKTWKALLQVLKYIKVRTVTLPVDALQEEQLDFKYSFTVEHQSSD